MKTTSLMAKLCRAAVAVLFLTLVPGLAAAQSATVDQAGDTLKLTLGSTPGTVQEVVSTASGFRPEVGTIWLGSTLGLGIASDFTGFALRPQVAFVATQLDSNLYLDVAGHFGLTIGSGANVNQQFWEIVPAARLRYAISPKVAVYGDAGFGLAIFHASAQNYDASDTSVGAVLRFPLGLRYSPTSNIDIVFEPGGFNVYFTGADWNGTRFMYTLLVGALFRVG